MALLVTFGAPVGRHCFQSHDNSCKSILNSRVSESGKGEILYAILTRPKIEPRKSRLKAQELNHSHPAIGDIRMGITRFQFRLRLSGDGNAGYSLSYHAELHIGQLYTEPDPPEP